MRTGNIEPYYHLLNIKPGATEAEIKRAYRKKAAELHPDRNPREDAHEQFVMLTEAYEYLLAVHTGKVKYQAEAMTQADWEVHQKEQARYQARAYAKMKFEEFTQTDYYKKSQAALTVFEHLYFFLALGVMLCPLWGFFYQGWVGLGIGALLTFFTVHFWSTIFTEKSTISFRTFMASLGLVVKTKTFRYVIITVFNLGILFRFTLNTQLTLLGFGLILAALYGAFILGYFFLAPGMKKFSKLGLFLCVVPGIFNAFFFTNYMFSSSPTQEVYSFTHQWRWYGGSISRYRKPRFRLEKTAYIHLENHQYKEYKWFRVFLDFEVMKDKQEITYTFEEGLFGLRVLKGYEFTR
jgi:hypothetical protein